LQDHYGVNRNDARWLMAEPLTSDGAMGGEWAHTHQRGGIKASELIQRLGSGELDAVIYPGGAGGHWFNWVIDGGVSRTPDPYGDLEQMVASSSNLCFPFGDLESHLAWFKKEGIYPTYHFLAIRKSIAEQQSGLADACQPTVPPTERRHMNGAERRLYDRERSCWRRPQPVRIEHRSQKDDRVCGLSCGGRLAAATSDDEGIFPISKDLGRRVHEGLAFTVWLPKRITDRICLPGETTIEASRDLRRSRIFRGVEEYGLTASFLSTSRAANGLRLRQICLFYGRSADPADEDWSDGNCSPLHHPVRLGEELYH
jgi:hypothetical protein